MQGSVNSAKCVSVFVVCYNQGMKFPAMMRLNGKYAIMWRDKSDGNIHTRAQGGENIANFLNDGENVKLKDLPEHMQKIIQENSAES